MKKTPPPHSTGAAVDVTLVDDNKRVVDMGSPIDEMSERSLPDYFANNSVEAQQYHAHRQLLHNVMLKAGFQRNPREWWHFSLGENKENVPHKVPLAFHKDGEIPPQTILKESPLTVHHIR